MQRSRAGFLAARLLKLRDDGVDSGSGMTELDADIRETRRDLRQVVQRYARLLSGMGQPRGDVLRLVEELAVEADYNRLRSSDVLIDEMKRELTGWAAQAMAAD